MHHCLQVLDILHLIFECVRENAHLATLVNLAVTCKLFCEPALDVLWWSVPSAYALLNCLPDDIWEQTLTDRAVGRGKVVERSKRKFRRVPNSSELSRCQFYTHRVRRFGVQDPPNMRISSRRMHHSDEFLSQFDVKMFPNLRELVYYVPYQEPDTISIYTYLGPSLISLSLHWDCRPSSFLRICEEIQRVCPFMEKLSVYHVSLGQHSSIFSPSIVQFSALVSSLHLRVFHCHRCQLSDSALQHLSQLPHLKQLEVGNTVDDLVRAIKASNSLIAPFTGLCLLSIMAADFGRAGVDLSKIISSTDIQELTLDHTLDKVPSEQEIHAFFQALADSPWKDSLSSLELHRAFDVDPESDVWTSPVYRVTSSTFKPLFSLPNLQFVQLRLENAFDLDNATLSDMARAWPKLSTLDIGCGGTWGISEGGLKITLDGLLPLVQHCPRLNTFSLCVNAAYNPASPSSRPGAGITNEKVLILNFCNSTISDPLEVALFLSDVFPNLLDIVAWSEGWLPTEDSHSATEKWNEVCQLLPALTRARRQERAYRAQNQSTATRIE
ncbi:hypothetical protein VKT23_002830 [Stygiomarasmius scandens]|uniref:F-box domain-containing protein n=1 Tax=Marasmiellus scandens TaxID=2682957 RepID=A0ABR1JVD9_9AGAR